MGELVRYIKGIPVGIPFRAVLDPLPTSAVSKKDCETFIILPYRSLQVENTIINIVPERISSKSKPKTASVPDVQELPEDVPVFKVVSDHDVDTLKPKADIRFENAEESEVIEDKQFSHSETTLEDGSEAGNSRYSSGEVQGQGEGHESDGNGQESVEMNSGSTTGKTETQSIVRPASAAEERPAPGNSDRSSSHGDEEESESSELCVSNADEDKEFEDSRPGSTGNGGEPTNKGSASSAVESPVVGGNDASAGLADVQVQPHSKEACTTHSNGRKDLETDTSTISLACLKNKSGRKRSLDVQEPAQKIRVVPLDSADNEDENSSSRRRSQRIRSKGVRVDYTSIENMYAADLSDSNTDSAADEDDNILALYHDAENTSDSSEEEDANSESEQNSKSGDKQDPDFDPFDMQEGKSGSKEKKVANARRQNQSASWSESEASADSANESSDNAVEKADMALKRRLERRKRKSLTRLKGPQITVQLEQHQDKYRKTPFKSFARKDRNKQFSEEMLECLICNGFSTSDKVPMEKHLEQHLNGELNCRKCDHIASSTYSLSQHFRSVHEKTAFVCEECGKKFLKGSWLMSFRTHMGKVHNKPMFSCQWCKQKDGLDARFITKKDMKTHQQQEHMDLLKECDSCGRLLNKRHYGLHMENCKGRIESPCERCGKMVSAGAMVEHVRKEHERVLSFKCPHCDYIADRSNKLTRHLKIHQGMYCQLA